MDASEVPDRDESNPAPGGEAASGGTEGQPEAAPGLKGLRSLRRLRDRVQAAAHELQALRQENAALQKRIAELERGMPEAAGDGGAGTAALALEGDPELLRRKVEGFITAIDRFLEEDSRVG
ncbi:MAG: hypothetical protein R2834_20965 [Rhodothermales bacterium]